MHVQQRAGDLRADVALGEPGERGGREVGQVDVGGVAVLDHGRPGGQAQVQTGRGRVREHLAAAAGASRSEAGAPGQEEGGGEDGRNNEGSA